LFYFDGETALAACVLRATTEKCQLLLAKKCMRVTLLADLEMTGLSGREFQAAL